MKLLRKVGSTSQILQVFIRDSSSGIGSGLAGLTNGTSGLTAYYHRDSDTTATAISLVTMTVGTFTSSGFKEIDSSNMPGWYQFCPPNAALNTGAANVGFHLKGATNMAPLPVEIDLDGNVDVTHWNGTAVASPATAGIPDVNVKNINNVAAATPGASGGVLISGSNSGTTTLGALTVTGASTLTGNVSLAAGLTVTQSTTNGAGVSITGNGSGDGIILTAGATGRGIHALGGATSGAGARFEGQGASASGFHALGFGASGAGFRLEAGTTTANGMMIIGGSSSGAAVSITTTSGDGISVAPTAGHGLNLAANGTSKHGIVSTGGTAGTSDGVNCAAGTGGVDLRANQTGNITGNVSGSVGSVTAEVTANVSKINSVATSSVTTVNANVGSTQPVNFTGTGASALVKSDMVDVAGSAVSTSTAQLGVNAVQVNAVSTSSVTTINANIGSTQPVNFTGTGASALVKSDTVDIAGAAVSTSSAQIGVNLVNWNGTAATSTVPPDAIFIRSGTAQSGAATTITLDAGASATDNLYQDEVIFIRSGTGAGQCNLIVSYVGSTKVATVLNTWATNPDNTSVFTIKASGPAEATVSGTVSANVTKWNGTTVATPATAGIPDVNAKNVNNVSTSSVTTISANLGSTQPVNFTGAAGSALVKSDMVDVAGSAVSTSTAQIGVNAVNIGGTAQTGRDIGSSVLLSTGTGTGQLDFTSGVVKSNLVQILGTALTETAGQIAAAFKKFFNIATPASTMDHLTLLDTVTTATTATNLTNAATAGDFTSTMKTSLNNSTPASITGAVGSVTARVTANTDQFAGQTVTAAAGVTLPTSVASPTNITAGTITTVTNLTNAPTSGDFTSTMKTSLNAATPSVTVSDKTGFSLSTAGIKAIWDQLTSALTTVGSIGKRIVDFLTGDSYTRLGAPAGASIAADIQNVLNEVNNTESNTVTIMTDTSTINSNTQSIKNKTDQMPNSWPTNMSLFDVDSNGSVTIQPHQLMVKKNVPLPHFEFVMYDSTDHETPKTGLTVTAKRSIDSGAFATAANAVAEVGSGVYSIRLEDTDMNGGVITLKCSATGADDTFVTFVTQT